GRRPGPPRLPVLREPHRSRGSRVPGHERAREPRPVVTPTAPQARTPDEDLAALLAGGDLQVLGLLPRSSNSTFLAKACHDDREALVVYKPRSGETPLWDFPEGTLCRREVAAYVVARELGWPEVPPTLLRDGPQGEGS